MIPSEFKKKNKAKPSTDRSHNMTLNNNKKDIADYNSVNPSSLLEKQKQYSMAIR